MKLRKDDIFGKATLRRIAFRIRQLSKCGRNLIISLPLALLIIASPVRADDWQSPPAMSYEQAYAECEVYRQAVYPGEPGNGGGRCWAHPAHVVMALSPGGFHYDNYEWPYKDQPDGPNLGNGGGCDGGTGGGGPCPATKGSPNEGDPINAITGNKYLEETDTATSQALTFRRFYNSLPSVKPGGLGAHWRHSFDRTLTVFRSTTTTGNVGFAVAYRPDGKIEVFGRRVGDVWAAGVDNPDRLSTIKNGDLITGYTLYIGELRIQENYDGNGRLISITDTDGKVTRFTYSDATTPSEMAPHEGLLISVSAADGRSLTLAYDGLSRVKTLGLPDDSIISYQYDSDGNLAKATWPDGSARTFAYNEADQTAGNNFPAVLTGIIDENGARYETTSYGGNGQAFSTYQGNKAGIVSISSYPFPDNRAIVTYALGATSTKGHATINGRIVVTSRSNSCGTCGDEFSSRSYDANGRPASYTDFNGNSTVTQYDPNGLLVQKIQAKGTKDQRTTLTQWDVGLRRPIIETVTDADGRLARKTAWSYNARGQATAECTIDPGLTSNYTCGSQANAPSGVHQTRYTYCDAVDTTQCPLIGLLLSTDGPRTDVNDITRMRYYLTTDESGCGQSGGTCHRAGDLYHTVDAAGHTATVLAYDKAGRIVRQSDANGVITDLAYSPRGWLTRRTVRANADGSASNADAVTIMAYDPTGTLHSVTDPDNVTVTYGYDDAHRLTDITDGLGNRIHYTLDAAGNRTKEETLDASHTLRRSVIRVYNSLGQLITVKDGLGQTVFDASANGSYDANGNLVQSRGALGAIHQDVVDALNRVVTSIDNANGADLATKDTTNQYVFDALDRLTSVTDPDGLSTHYGFDGLGNPSSLQSPDTGSSSATFDAAGNTLTKTDAKGITVTNTYDALNRLVSASYVDTRANADYHFDEANSVTGCATSYPQGRLTRVVEPAVTTTFCYDFQGQVTEKRQTQGTVTDTVSYVHTRAGRLAAIGTPSGAVTEYGRDSLGQITSVTVTPAQGTATPVVTTASYLPFGPISSYTLGNGQTITRTYDANYRATDVVSPALNLHFARDAAGNIVALGDAAGASPASETYKYDPLYRLTSVNDPSGGAVEAYTYNKTGDRLSKTAPGSSTGIYQYQVGTHKLSTIGTASHTFDANGSMTGSASGGIAWGYGYDGRGRLSVVQQGGRTVATYVHNALGQRIAKSNESTSVRFIYDESNQVLSESGSPERDYVWLGLLPIATVDGTSIAFVHADALNTSRAITDSSGAIIWQWSYRENPFGESKTLSNGGYVYNLRYPGQYFDIESGLNYNIKRTYDASSGRYIQSDPIGLNGGINTYAYVHQNPINFVDPLGLCEDDRCRKVKEDALEECSDSAIPSYDNGFRFWNCVNAYLAAHGCGPGGKPIPDPEESPAAQPPDDNTKQRAIAFGVGAAILRLLGALLLSTP